MRCNSCNSDYVVVTPISKKVGNKLLKANYRCLGCETAWFESEKMKAICTGEKPSYANQYAAGLDLKANEDILIKPGQIVDIKSKLAVEMPIGHFGMVVARSGLSYKRQIKLINDVGIIDEDYRGDIGIRLINEGTEYYTIKKGDRIGQLIVVPYIQPELLYVDELSKTNRGKKGFGSTGK